MLYTHTFGCATLVQPHVEMVVVASLIAATMALSAWMLVTRARMPVLSNLTLIALFGLLFHCVNSSFQTAHFDFREDSNKPVEVADTMLSAALFAAHVADIGDLLQIFDEVTLQNAQLSALMPDIPRPRTVLAKSLMTILLVWIGLFTGTVLLLLRNAFRSRFGAISGRIRIAKSRVSHHRQLLLGAFVGFAVLAASEGWSAKNWIVWPLGNVLHAVDTFDMLYLWFGRIHGVHASLVAGAVAFCFRFGIALYVLDVSDRATCEIRLGWLHGAFMAQEEIAVRLVAGSSRHRLLAIRCLERLQELGPETLAAVFRATQDSDDAVRNRALSTLEHIPLTNSLATGLAHVIAEQSQNDALLAAFELRRFPDDEILKLLSSTNELGRRMVSRL